MTTGNPFNGVTLSPRYRLGCRGVMAIEYALILPVFLAMVFGIIEISRLMWYQVSLQRATAVAARCGALAATSCATDELIKTKAAAGAPGIKFPATAFTVTHDTCGVRVTASLPFNFATGMLGLPAKTLKANYCHPKTS